MAGRSSESSNYPDGVQTHDLPDDTELEFDEYEEASYAAEDYDEEYDEDELTDEIPDND